MRFVRLLRAASLGLLQQIPVMGPVIQSILAENAHATSELKLTELVTALTKGRLPLESTGTHPCSGFVIGGSGD